MSAIDRYRKKPVVIDAIQWTGDNLRAVICFTDGPPDTRTSHAGMMWEHYADLVQSKGLKIYTLEGTMNADIGDYIIKGVKGEFYPCKPDIFAATYEPAAIRAPLAEALAVVLEALKDGEVWGRAVNAATPILRSDLDQSAWVTVDETREAIEAALRAIGGDA